MWRDGSDSELGMGLTILPKLSANTGISGRDTEEAGANMSERMARISEDSGLD